MNLFCANQQVLLPPQLLRKLQITFVNSFALRITAFTHLWIYLAANWRVRMLPWQLPASLFLFPFPTLPHAHGTRILLPRGSLWPLVACGWDAVRTQRFGRAWRISTRCSVSASLRAAVVLPGMRAHEQVPATQ